MRTGVAGVGVLLMLVGALLFFTAFGSVGSGSSTTPTGSGPFALVSTGSLGIIVGFIGFLVFIVGLAASPDTPSLSAYPSAAGWDAGIGGGALHPILVGFDDSLRDRPTSDHWSA
jgi:hypothetical protein